jgi:Uma2 family endonuclease
MNIPLQYRVDFDQFCLRIREDQKADLIAGVIYMASPENLHANDLGGLLAFLMRGIVEAHASGRVFSSRVAFKLDDENAPEPDIAFVAATRLGILREGYVDGPPDLSLEIVSPESVDRDHTTKQALYARFGVREYWIVDPLQQLVMLLRLGSRRRYRTIRPRGGRFHSDVLPGWFLDATWLWQDPLPAALPLLQQMLGDSATS